MTTPSETLAAIRDYFVALGADRTAWSNAMRGSATGGPGGDGFYPLPLSDGSTIQVPSVAKLIAASNAGISAVQAITAVQGAMKIFTPEQYAAAGDAAVTSGTFVGTDDTAAVVAAYNAAKAARGTMLLSRWYRITSPLPVMSTPFAIQGPGRYLAGLVLDKSATGAAITIQDCWMGNDGDEIASPTPNVRVPGATSSGARLRGFSILGDRATTNVQAGIRLARRNDHLRMEDIGIYHINGCALDIGYDDRAVGSRRACTRESYIEADIKWCGNATNHAMRYVSEGGQAPFTSDDASNNNLFNLRVDNSYYGGPAILVECRNVNEIAIRNDRWISLQAEGANGDILTISGNVINSDFGGLLINPTDSGTFGIVLKEYPGHTTAAAGYDCMPRQLTFSGVDGGRTGTHGAHLIYCKNVDFTKYWPSAGRPVGGDDYHYVIETQISGRVNLGGPSGYRLNIQDNTTQSPTFVRVDPGGPLSAISDSNAGTVSGLLPKFNAILATLRAAGILSAR